MIFIKARLPKKLDVNKEKKENFMAKRYDYEINNIIEKFNIFLKQQQISLYGMNNVIGKGKKALSAKMILELFNINQIKYLTEIEVYKLNMNFIDRNKKHLYMEYDHVNRQWLYTTNNKNPNGRTNRITLTEHVLNVKEVNVFVLNLNYDVDNDKYHEKEVFSEMRRAYEIDNKDSFIDYQMLKNGRMIIYAEKNKMTKNSLKKIIKQ